MYKVREIGVYAGLLHIEISNMRKNTIGFLNIIIQSFGRHCHSHFNIGSAETDL